MKNLLRTSAVIEVSTGIILLIIPSMVVYLLLGESLSDQIGILLGRMFGVALITLSVACWMARNDTKSSVTMIRALLLYNMGMVILLLYARSIGHFFGMGLWPAVLVHIALLVWCVQSLRSKEKG